MESSSSRIERKRAHDREAQRASRAKTKAYIAHLERTVADLSQSSGDNRANYLARHVSKQAQELETMQALMQKIRSLVQEAPRLEQGLQDAEADDDQAKASGIKVQAQQSSPPDSKQLHESPEALAYARDIAAQIPSCATQKMAEFGESLICDEGDPHYLQRLNRALTKVEQTTDVLSGCEEDEDILIRAMIEGWEATAKMHQLDVSWRLFREADETLWCRIRPIDRLAHFWQMRSTMLNKIQPRNQERRITPSFMSATAVQRADAAHPVVTDYFAWPHVRDNLITTGIAQISGRQTIAFAESFRFIWQYEMRDAYKVNTSTGFYSLSEAFMRNFNNLACYRILQSGDSTDIPTRLIPQLSWRPPDRVAECRSPEEHGSDSSPEIVPASDVCSIAQPSLVHNSYSPDWMGVFGLDATPDPRFMNFNVDSMHMATEPQLCQWPDI